MVKKFPKRKVGIVTFSTDVVIIGNHPTKGMTMEGNILNDASRIVSYTKKSYEQLMTNNLA